MCSFEVGDKIKCVMPDNFGDLIYGKVYIINRIERDERFVRDFLPHVEQEIDTPEDYYFIYIEGDSMGWSFIRFVLVERKHDWMQEGF